MMNAKCDSLKKQIDAELHLQRHQIREIKGMLESMQRLLIRLEDDVQQLPRICEESLVCHGDGKQPTCPLAAIQREMSAVSTKALEFLKQDNLLGSELNGPTGCCQMPIETNCTLAHLTPARPCPTRCPCPTRRVPSKEPKHRPISKPKMAAKRRVICVKPKIVRPRILAKPKVRINPPGNRAKPAAKRANPFATEGSASPAKRKKAA